MNTVEFSGRYATAKWQALVKPADKAFRFANGVVVSCLWELKQALLTLSEDVVRHHVRENSNDIANWVEFVVGDVDLAQEIVKYKHRWGMIVALERQMMRTLALPAYLASRWLMKVDWPFVFQTGEKVESLESLRDVLGKVGDEAVEFHRERSPNDIAVWVLDVVGDYQLAELLAEATNRSQMRRYVADHIVMLKDAAEC